MVINLQTRSSLNILLSDDLKTEVSCQRSSQNCRTDVSWNGVEPRSSGEGAEGFTGMRTVKGGESFQMCHVEWFIRKVPLIFVTGFCTPHSGFSLQSWSSLFPPAILLGQMTHEKPICPEELRQDLLCGDAGGD